MIPSQGGREGYNGSANPPSNGSEDNGFANRPRVAGLYATNLFREELVRFSSGETTRSHGLTRDTLERSPREIGSQRSLNLPTGIAEEFELLDRSRVGISRTPQPLRRGETDAARYEPRSRFDESAIRRRDHYGSPPVERIHDREDEQQEECITRSACSTLRVSLLEFPRSEQTTWMESDVGDSKIPVSTDDLAGRRGPDDSSTFVTTSASILISPASETSECDAISPPEVEKSSPPPYTGLSPPEYTGQEYETSETPSPIFPNYPLTSYAEETHHRRSRSSVSDAGLEFTARDERLKRDSRFESEPEEALAEEIGRSRRTRSNLERCTDDDVSRSRDVARLRPPLAAAAGVSADSGTGDSGSAEIQVDPLGIPRTTTAGEILDGRNGVENGQAASKSSIKTPTGNNKQTVKLFTKESLDRLENKTVQLVRDYGFQPKRRMSVEDGAVLPNKFEPFPTELYGRPLEEIDNFIYDEVRLWTPAF